MEVSGFRCQVLLSVESRGGVMGLRFRIADFEFRIWFRAKAREARKENIFLFSELGVLRVFARVASVADCIVPDFEFRKFTL